MKRFLLLLLLFTLPLVALSACNGPLGEPAHSSPGTSSALIQSGTSAPTGTSAGTAIETTAVHTTAPATEPDTTYEDIFYNTEPVVQEDGEPLIVNWNPYLVSLLIKEAGEAYTEGMQAMIHAILNRRLTVTFSSLEVMKTVCDNLFYEFPPAALVSLSPNEETLTVRIRYTLDRTAHLSAIAAFEASLEALFPDTLLSNDSEAVKALLLYHFVATHVDYFSVNYATWQTNAYYALTEGQSICYGFADLYNYLLRQVGIDAYLVKGARRADKAAHGWSLVKIDGIWYHCDPTWEDSAYDGAAFMYFGQTDATRSKVLLISEAVVGEGSLLRRLIQTVTDERFSAINGNRIYSDSWELDREKQAFYYFFRYYSFAK